MKFCILILLCLFISGLAYTQSKSEKVKERLEELFVLSANDKYQQAASYIVYRGEDKPRQWKETYDYNNETEGAAVDQICRGIKSLLKNGGDYEFVKFQTEKESEGEWCIWEVEFAKGEKKKVYFAFLKIDGNYCLGDID